MKNKKIFYLILSLSLLLNLAYFKYDTFDYLWPKVKDKFIKVETIQEVSPDTEERIVQSALEMLKSNEALMVWEEDYGLSKKILLKNSETKKTDFRRYNYPRAYLFYGLIDYAITFKRDDLINEAIKEFDKYILENGKPNFNLNKIDQIVFGVTAIKLYDYTGNKKYKIFSNFLFQFLIQSTEDELVLYRPNQKIYLNDVLGMIIPFLIEYNNVMGIPNDELSKTQMDFFIQYGVDNKTHIPSHGIQMKSKAKIGSSNWGRGIGWYYIALANYYKETGEYEEEYLGITNTLNKLKNNEDLWSQFPGSSEIVDTSSTTMFLYGMQVVNPKLYSKREILEKLKNYLAKDGAILQTSGDTYAANNYSKSFGKSELSQGMLLLLLANAK